MRQTAIVKHVGPGGASIEIGGTIIHSALLANTVPAQDLHPGDLVSIQWVDGKPHVVAVLTWRGEYHAVPDEVAPQIVSYEEGEPGSTVHGELFGLEEDDHDQYVHVGLSRVITAQHTVAPTTEMAPFALGEFAQGQTVIGLRADQLNKSVVAGDGLVGGGLLTQDATLTLNTPGTLGVGSLNLAAGNHTHAIEHASNVQDGATKLLSSNAGLLVLKKLGVSGTPADGYLAKIGGSMELEGNLVFTGATREIQTSTGDLYLAPAGKTQSSKDLTFTGYNRVSEAYVSGAFGAGYAIGHTDGGGSYLEVDNVTVRGSLRTHIFQKDIVRATNGYLYIADSTEITDAANVAYSTIYVKDAVFQVGDLLWYKDYDLGSHEVISEVKMTVTLDLGSDERRGQDIHMYEVSLDAGDLADLDAGGTIVRVGGSATGRQGAVFIDAASQFSPFLDVYAGVASWADFHSPSKVKSRFGRLDGITAGTNEYGLLAGSGIADTDKYLRLSNLVARINNIPVMVYKGGNAVIVLDPDAPYLGVGAVAPSAWLGAPGFWTGLHDGQYKTYVGDNDGSRLQWDGLDLSIYDKNNSPVLVSGQSGNWLSSLMISESLGQHLFSQADGLALWGPGCELTPTAWVSTRGQRATINGAFRTGPGAWANTRALQVAQYTVNKVLNPNLGGTYSSGIAPSWSKGGTAASLTCTESTAFKVFGEKCQKLVFAPGATNPYFYTTPDSMAYNTTYTWQVWLYVESFDTGVRVRFGAGDRYLDTSITEPGFHHVVSTGETGSSGSTWLTLISGLGGNAVVYLLGAQCEGGPDATPLAAGDMGSGYSFTGTPYESTTIRQATNVSADMGAFSPTAGTIAIRCKQHAKRATNSYLCRPGDGSAMDIFQASADNSIAFRIAGITRCSIPGGDWNAGEELDLVFTYDVAGNESKAYLNGELKATGTCPSFTPGTSFRIGGLGSGDYQWNGWISQFGVLGSVLTADQVAAMHASGRPLVDAGSTQSPGLYILDGRFTIASSTSGTRLVLNNTSLAIGNGVGYKSGAGVWTGIDTDGAAKLFVGSSSGTNLDYDGSSLWLRANSSNYMKASGSQLEFYGGGVRRILIDNSGNVIVGRGDAERVQIATTGVSLYSGGNRTGWWQSDGDLFLGSNVENPATTHACFFAASQWYNNEQFAAGDILLGDNSSGKANIVFDYDQATLWFRAGSRQMRLNAYGLQLEVPSSGSDIGIVWRRNSFSIDEAYIKWERSNNLLRIVTGNTADSSFKPMVFQQTKSGPTNQVPLYISGSRRTVSIFTSNPQAATLYVSNPGDVNPALWVNQPSGAGAAIRIQTTGEYDKILAFNFNCDTYSGSGYRALRVWVEGIGSRWLRLYDLE